MFVKKHIPAVGDKVVLGVNKIIKTSKGEFIGPHDFVIIKVHKLYWDGRWEITLQDTNGNVIEDLLFPSAWSESLVILK